MQIQRLAGKALAVVRRKKVSIIIMAVLIVAAGAAYYAKGWLIVATVNGQPVTRLRVIQLLEEKSGKQALDSIISQMLIQNEAKARGVSVSSDEIDQEVKKAEESITAQGSTLAAALRESGMTMKDLRDQIEIQKEVEKMLANESQVSDQEIEQYIKDNKVTIPKDGDANVMSQIREQLKQQKLSQAGPQFVQDLKSKAKINYYVYYANP